MYVIVDSANGRNDKEEFGNRIYSLILDISAGIARSLEMESPKESYKINVVQESTGALSAWSFVLPRMGGYFSYPNSRIVETSYGKIQGRRLVYSGDKQVDAFQKPVKPKSWNGVKETKGFGPRSIHAIDSDSPAQIGSEDCLYLNVFAPVAEPMKDDGYPVMVFIHGGAFEMGDAPTYGDLNICENIVSHDVIFVTIQYRLGYMGFFTTGDDACPGNLGLWDQVAALTWIQRNIEAFGGNKYNITLLGLSAGGASVDMLHCCPHSTNLFQKAIIMAGSAECRWAMNMSMTQQCLVKAERLGVKDWKSSQELLDKLREVPANKLAVIYSEEIKMEKSDFETVPVIDGDFFPASLDELRQRATPKPMMTGVTKEEGLLFILNKTPTEENLRWMIELAAQDSKDKDTLSMKLRDCYVGSVTVEDKDKFMRCIANLASDYYVNAGVLEMCRKTTSIQNEPVFLYVLEHHNPGSMGENENKMFIKDCTHTSEVQFLFKRGRFATPSFTETDNRVTHLFTKTFTNFAKYGNPNGPDVMKSDLPVVWKPIDQENYGRNIVIASDNTYMTNQFFDMGNLFSYPDSRIVETSYGKVQGRRLIYKGDKQVDAFQGIPFAKPPVGELRFKKPEAPEKWDGVKDTKKFGPRSIVGAYFHWAIDSLLMGKTSEDCLYLNVFTPCWKAPENGFPVMVFIHGGAFELGDAISYGDIGICENIVTQGVIFVTIQYRVGYLGFMTTADSSCPGNNGLWDQTAALRWVNDNIDEFGGDKKNITVLGQSAGGASVDMLHISPHSTNLFHKMIPMAGSAECRWASNKNMPQQCRKKAANLGITDYANSEEFLEKLRGVPADKFGVVFLKRDKEPEVDFETVPLIDGDFFPESFDELRKKATPKLMMTGVTKEEGLLFIPGKKATEDDLKEVITLAIHDAKDKEKLANDLKSAYFPAGIPDDKEVFLRRIANIASDYWFNAAVAEMCRKTVAIQKEPVYFYLFEHYNPKVMGFMGKQMPIQDCTHAAELIYLFKKGLFANVALTEDDIRVMYLFTTAFTNFAKYGNPNGAEESKSDLLVYWEPLDKENHSRNFVITSNEPYMSDNFFEGRVAKFVETVKSHA
ncbi:hypothetical protein PRIPAC_93002 [Pristionchus pacificus]|uniref:Hydrolase n=1 Tax=Pristionchus pacificus TaxID=54126 RepID=A0A2A6CHU7_PRIPA|nr:hypothetical protein PRIPAC_93002 [Pristionchus pacificus]|eukprot:PDM77648.1 hydrolase [Pristionchus pacificus]